MVSCAFVNPALAKLRRFGYLFQAVAIRVNDSAVALPGIGCTKSAKRIEEAYVAAQRFSRCGEVVRFEGRGSEGGGSKTPLAR